MTEPPRRRRRRRRVAGGSRPEAVAAARFRRLDMRQLAREKLRQDIANANSPNEYIEALIDDGGGSNEPWISPPGGGL
jgi:hypothetical protein